MKLKKLIEGMFPENEENKFDEQAFLESVRGYNSYGKSIYREGLSDTAKKLSEIAKLAGVHAVKETEDSFDKITVSRNMKELKSYSDQFSKVANEAHGLQQRMEGLYEDMGRVLSRYYEIAGEEDQDEMSEKKTGWVEEE